MRRVRSMGSAVRVGLHACAWLVPIVVLGACGSGSGGTGTFLPIVRLVPETSSTIFCCDPAGAFPLAVGTVTYHNYNHLPIRVEFENTSVLRATPSDRFLQPGESVTVTIEALSCPPAGSSLIVRQYHGPIIIGSDRVTVVDPTQCATLEPIVGLVDRAKGGILEGIEFQTGLEWSVLGEAVPAQLGERAPEGAGRRVDRDRRFRDPGDVA